MRDAQDIDVLVDGDPAAPSAVGPVSDQDVYEQSVSHSQPNGGRYGSRSTLAAIVVAVVVAVIDQVTKWWALGALQPGSCAQPDACIDLFAGIRFRLVFNTGAAFTTGSGFGPVLAVLAFVMTGVLLVMASKRPDRLGAVLLGAIAGGAVGNLIDRVFRADGGLFNGAVVDFIDLGWWPVFNIADSAIVVGVAAVIVSSLFERSDTPDDESETADQPDDELELDDGAADDLELE